MTLIIGLWVFLAGLFFGLVYFGGLWLTIRRLDRFENTVVLFALSYVFRSVFVLVGFYLVMSGSWLRLLVVLIGFLIARVILVRMIGQELSLSPKFQPVAKDRI